MPKMGILARVVIILFLGEAVAFAPSQRQLEIKRSSRRGNGLWASSFDEEVQYHDHIRFH